MGGTKPSNRAGSGVRHDYLRFLFAAICLFLALSLLESCGGGPELRIDRVEPPTIKDGQPHLYTVHGRNFLPNTQFELVDSSGLVIPGLLGSSDGLLVGPSDGLHSNNRAASVSPDGTNATLWLAPLSRIDQNSVTLNALNPPETEPASIVLPLSTDWLKLRERVSKMSLREMIGQTLLVGLDTGPYDPKDDRPRQERAKSALAQMIKDFALGGVYLHPTNLTDLPDGKQQAEFVGALTSEFRELLPARLPAPFIAIDQEGGDRNTLEQWPISQFPAAGFLSLEQDLFTIYGVGQATARELAALGINVILGPVLDVDRQDGNPRNVQPIAGLRTFGGVSGHVARAGAAMAAGYRSAGLLPVLKHFPGHGMTSSDPHFEFVEVDIRSERELEDIDVAPFRTLIKMGMPAVMTAHLGVSVWEQQSITFSTDLLNNKLRLAKNNEFNGLVFTDDLAAMRSALTPHKGANETDRLTAVKNAHLAGSDVVLLTSIVPDTYMSDNSRLLHQHDLETLIELLENAYSKTDPDLNERVLRILRAKQPRTSEVLPTALYEGPPEEHRQLAADIVQSEVVLLTERGSHHKREDFKLFGSRFGPLSAGTRAHPHGLGDGDIVAIASPVSRAHRRNEFADKIRDGIQRVPRTVYLRTYPIIYDMIPMPHRETDEAASALSGARKLWADSTARPRVEINYDHYRTADGRLHYGDSGAGGSDSRDAKIDDYLSQQVASLLEVSKRARYVVMGLRSLQQVELAHRFQRALRTSQEPPEDVLLIHYLEPYLLTRELLEAKRFSVVWAPAVPDLGVSIKALFDGSNLRDHLSVPFRFPGVTDAPSAAHRDLWGGKSVAGPILPPVVHKEDYDWLLTTIIALLGGGAALIVAGKLWQRHLSPGDSTSAGDIRLAHAPRRNADEAGEMAISRDVTGGSTRVFLSYNHEDSDSASKLCAALKRVGVSVHIDSEAMQAGEDISAFIKRSIQETDATLCLVSNSSLRSAWVAWETIKTFYEEDSKASRRFIACYLDEDFFQPGFRLACTKRIDAEIARIDALLPDYAKKQLDPSDLNSQKTRLFALRNNLGEILLRLKDSLSLDIRGDQLGPSVARIIRTLRKD